MEEILYTVGILLLIFLYLYYLCHVYVKRIRRDFIGANVQESNDDVSLPPYMARETLTRRSNRASGSEASSDGSDDRNQRPSRPPRQAEHMCLTPPPPYSQLMLNESNREPDNVDSHQSYQNTTFRENLNFWRQIPNQRTPFVWYSRRNNYYNGPPPLYSAVSQSHPSIPLGSIDTGSTASTSQNSSARFENRCSPSRLSRRQSDDSDEPPPPYSLSDEASSELETESGNVNLLRQRDVNGESSDEYRSALSWSVCGSISTQSLFRSTWNWPSIESSCNNLHLSNNRSLTHTPSLGVTGFRSSDQSKTLVLPPTQLLNQQPPPSGPADDQQITDDESDEDPEVKRRNEMLIQNWLEGKLVLPKRRFLKTSDQQEEAQDEKSSDQQPGTSNQPLSNVQQDETLDEESSDVPKEDGQQ